MTEETHVFLVGAGPGDPELLTVKAHRLLQSVEVVVYDRLVSREILQLIPSGTKRIFVGKATGQHHMSQTAINELLVSLARAGRRVVRLKGGDPFVFGRGSEEARYLAHHGVAFEIVPGLTAATACSAYAGIPLTHRGLARGVRLVTGHCRSDEPLDLNWSSLSDPDTTLVFYMALANVGAVCERLMQAGRAAETPSAVIENGTTPRQRVCVGTLAGLPRMVAEQAVAAPVLIVIGEVVSFANELDWFRPQRERYHSASPQAAKA